MAIERIGEVVVDGISHPIQIDGDASRFEIPIGDEAAVIVFRQRGTRISLIHTEVPRQLQRKGLAEALAKAALDYARTH